MADLKDRLQGRRPKFALILGSSLGALAEAVADSVSIPYGELSGFPVPKISGHAGKLVLGRLGDQDVAVLAGRAHPYESGNAAVMKPALQQLRDAGIETLILTNAAGSLKASMGPGSLMLLSDHINCAGMNPLIGQHGDSSFVSMTNAYDAALRKQMLMAAKTEKITLKQGVYCWYSGPSFETPAEIRMMQIIGGTAVGMSTAPETILARWLGMKVVAISTITNLAAGIKGASPSHDETKREGAKASAKLQRLIIRFLKEMN